MSGLSVSGSLSSIGSTTFYTVPAGSMAVFTHGTLTLTGGVTAGTASVEVGGSAAMSVSLLGLLSRSTSMAASNSGGDITSGSFVIAGPGQSVTLSVNNAGQTGSFNMSGVLFENSSP